MAKRYKVIYERTGCIGAGSCVAALPQYWSLDKDSKATLKSSKKTNTSWELELEEKLLPKMMEAAQACPVSVIHIIDLSTGQQLV